MEIYGDIWRYMFVRWSIDDIDDIEVIEGV
jgi:hypothetical protein